MNAALLHPPPYVSANNAFAEAVTAVDGLEAAVRAASEMTARLQQTPMVQR